MRRPFVIALSLVALCGLVACQPESSNNAGASPEAMDTNGSGAAADNAEATASVQVECPSGGSLTIRVSPRIPRLPVFPPGVKADLDTIQCGFDAFSWNSFLALNHGPGGGFGTVDGDNPTVWENWPESSDIFLADGATPAAWPIGDPPPERTIPEVCQSVTTAGTKVIRQLAKRPDVLEESDEPFSSGPLIDTHGYFSRFEIVVNQDMYLYILDQDLYSKDGQAAFADAGSPVTFPCACDGGVSADTPTHHDCPQGGQNGATMIKAAWKILDTNAGDDPSTFHTAEALVYTPEIDGVPESCTKRLMGLVGFHIGHKTQPVPQWIWSTFEHVANAPTEGDTIPAGAEFNYFQPDCDDCGAVNQPPPQPWNPHDEPLSANGEKSQVMRAIALTDATMTMNSAVDTIIEGTVWENYQLISTQWPTNGSGSDAGTPSADNGWCDALNAVDLSGAPAPSFLANTTLETYIQGTVPQASSSCINCHLNATMTTLNDSFSDFTYLLERAQ